MEEVRKQLEHNINHNEDGLDVEVIADEDQIERSPEEEAQSI